MAALLNKTAWVTGASRGIGRATASALAAAGAHVLVHYGRSAQDAESLVAAIRSKEGRADSIQADLGTPDGATLLAKEVRSIVGERLDVLVSNAGISRGARSSRETRPGQPFGPCLCLDQSGIRDSSQKLGRHSWTARHSRKCSRA